MEIEQIIAIVSGSGGALVISVWVINFSLNFINKVGETLKEIAVSLAEIKQLLEKIDDEHDK